MFKRFSEPKIENLKSLDVKEWAKERGYKVIHEDSNANVVILGESHTEAENFIAQQELIKRARPKYLILESLPSEIELGALEKFKIWTLTDAQKELGIDFDYQKVFENLNKIIDQEVLKKFEDYKKEGLLEGETIDDIRKEYLGDFTFPNSANDLLDFPFYQWHPALSKAIVEFAGQQQSIEVKEKLDKLLEGYIWKMAPKNKAGFNKFFWTLHTTQKSGVKICGMDNAEAKSKLIELLKQQEENNDPEKEKGVKKEMAKLRREAMAKTIVEKTADGSSAIVIVGSRHINEQDPDNLIPLNQRGIKYISIKQDVQEKDFINIVLDEAEHRSKLTK